MDPVPIPSSTSDPSEPSEVQNTPSHTNVSVEASGIPDRECSNDPEAEVKVKQKRPCSKRQYEALARARESKLKKRLQMQDVTPLHVKEPIHEPTLTSSSEPAPKQIESERATTPIVDDTKYNELEGRYKELESHYRVVHQYMEDRMERKRRKREERQYHGIPQYRMNDRAHNKIMF